MKTCAKCGGEGHLVCRPAIAPQTGERYTVDCEDNCGSTMPSEYLTPSGAAIVWNAFNDTLRAERINELASGHFATLHGHKMDGPRNETERVLLEISELSRLILNSPE